MLVARAFRAKRGDESHRARLRRSRAASQGAAEAGWRECDEARFALALRRPGEVIVLVRTVDEQFAGVLAFFPDGESWSSSALARALGASQRTVQRALEGLAAAGKVHSLVAGERAVG